MVRSLRKFGQTTKSCLDCCSGRPSGCVPVWGFRGPKAIVGAGRDLGAIVLVIILCGF
jgi:hypothetical protein